MNGEKDRSGGLPPPHRHQSSIELRLVRELVIEKLTDLLVASAEAVKIVSESEADRLTSERRFEPRLLRIYDDVNSMMNEMTD